SSSRKRLRTYALTRTHGALLRPRSSSCVPSRQGSTPTAASIRGVSWAESDVGVRRGGRLRALGVDRAKPPRRLCPLRLLPPRVPDLPVLGRGNGLAPRPYPSHARPRPRDADARRRRRR